MSFDEIAGEVLDERELWEKLADAIRPAGRHTGIVKWFSALKGFGFITPDDGSQETFVHYSAIEGTGYRNLREADRVEYDLVDRGRGPQAQNVKVLNRR